MYAVKSTARTPVGAAAVQSIQAILALILITFPILPASIIFIDCGSSSDQFFSGGLPYSVPNSVDKTIRMSNCSPTCVGANPFSYHIPVENIPYLVELGFQEASDLAPSRVFNVTVNGQLLAGMSLPPTTFGPIVRTLTASGIGGFMDIRYDSVRRSALASWIRLTPQPLPPASGLTHQTGIALVRQPNATYLLTPTNPLAPALNLVIFRNGAKQTLGTDYQLGMALVTPAAVYIVIAPLTAWNAGDIVTADVDQETDWALTHPRYRGVFYTYGLRPIRQASGTYALVPSFQSAPVNTLTVFRNTLPQQLGVDYMLTNAPADPPIQPLPMNLTIVPLVRQGGSAWVDTDAITCDFWQVSE